MKVALLFPLLLLLASCGSSSNSDTNSTEVLNPETDSNSETEISNPETDSNSETEVSNPETDSNSETEVSNPETDSNSETEVSNPETDSNSETEVSNPEADSNSETEVSNPEADSNSETEVSNPEADSNSETLSVLGNQIFFGSEEYFQVAEVKDGSFGVLDYITPASPKMLDIDFEISPQVSMEDLALVLRVDEVGTERKFVIIFPKTKLENGKLDGSSITEIYLYGVRSSGSPVVLSTSVDSEDILKFSEVVALFPEYESAINSIFKNEKSLKIVFALSGISGVSESKELYSDIVADFMGDFKMFIASKLIEGETFGFSGSIE